jgi:hypothetical protein
MKKRRRATKGEFKRTTANRVGSRIVDALRMQHGYQLSPKRPQKP